METAHESKSISKENLQKLQDHSPEWRRARNLHRRAAQAAPGLIPRYLLRIR
jgi:hypothetical protein